MIHIYQINRNNNCNNKIDKVDRSMVYVVNYILLLIV